MKKLRLIVTIDRPIGYTDSFGNTYPLNYGFIEGIIGGDSEKQDAYIVSKTSIEPMQEFTGVLVAIIHRKNDNEEKWVVTAENEVVSKNDIAISVNYLEKYFDSYIEII